MIQTDKSFFNINKSEYFSFNGRLARKQFAIKIIALYTILILFFLLIEPIKSVYGILYLIILLPCLWCIYASINRRFHDIGKSSKWTFMVFMSSAVPIIQVALMIYLFAKKGQIGPNQYGDDPLNKEQQY